MARLTRQQRALLALIVARHGGEVERLVGRKYPTVKWFHRSLGAASKLDSLAAVSHARQLLRLGVSAVISEP